jgi:anti-anti-sigma regulatory factor
VSPLFQSSAQAPLGYQRRGSIAVITLVDDGTPTTIPVMRSRIERAAAAGHPLIAVDLHALEHIAIPDLSELCVALRRAGRHGTKIAVVGADFRVQRVLELCAIDGVELHQTVSAVPGQRPTRQSKRDRWRPLSRLERSKPVRVE